MNRDAGRVWINFKELRARLKFEEVLAFYKVEVGRHGDQHQGNCPLPNHRGTGATNSFSVNFPKGIFQCFGCKAKGNVLEFAALMENVNPEDGRALRNVAVKLQRHFFPDGASTRSPGAEVSREPNKPSDKPALPVKINQPLDFELKGLDSGHAWLRDREFSRDTLAYFGVGFCSRGMLKDKIAVPLHEASGRLVGYAGHSIDEKTVGGEYPDYVFPEKRERDGIVHEFNRGLFLYNGHRIAKPCENLVIVMDFHSTWWLHQHGVRDVVAIMGEEPSEIQMDLAVQMTSAFSRIWVAPGGTRIADKLARVMIARLAPSRFVRWVRFDEGLTPSEAEAAELEEKFFL